MPLTMTPSKSIVITGASSGLGAALTTALSRDGHRLFICARRRDKLAQVSAESPNSSYFQCDVSSETEVKQLFNQIGVVAASIDVVIHCAAVSGPVGIVTEVDSDAWLAALNANLFGTFLVVKHAIQLMRPESRPRVILLSGGGAFDPMPNLSAYGVSKAGIVRLAETLAAELAPRNIAVNVLAPGFIATEFFDSIIAAGAKSGGELYQTILRLMRSWKDEDLRVPIDCARFLISDEAGPLTGKTISARHDPWDQPEFVTNLAEIAASKIYTTQRVGVDQCNDEVLAKQLSALIDRRRC
jgi:3-oxoacyl-[acyl-carrier protein] reductase